MLSSEATKLAAQGNRDLASGVFSFSICRNVVVMAPVSSRVHGFYRRNYNRNFRTEF